MVNKASQVLILKLSIICALLAIVMTSSSDAGAFSYHPPAFEPEKPRCVSNVITQEKNIGNQGFIDYTRQPKAWGIEQIDVVAAIKEMI